MSSHALILLCQHRVMWSRSMSGAGCERGLGDTRLGLIPGVLIAGKGRSTTEPVELDMRLGEDVVGLPDRIHACLEQRCLGALRLRVGGGAAKPNRGF